MAQVAWTLQALDDLDAVCLFIARDSPRVASLFAQEAFRATDLLTQFPARGRIVPEFGRPEIREIFVRSYRLLYRLRGDEVEILTIHHGARFLHADILGDE